MKNMPQRHRSSVMGLLRKCGLILLNCIFSSQFFPPRVDYFFLLHGTAAELSILLILLHTAFVAERLIGLGVSIKIRVVFVTLITFLFGIFSQMRAG